MKIQRLQIILPFLSLSLTVFMSVSLIRSEYSPFFIVLWIVSIALLILPFIRIKIKLTYRHLFLGLLICLPLAVRLMNLNVERLHRDEAILGYFSTHHSFSTMNFFSGVPKDMSQWQNQYPTTFFILQKTFFTFFGESILTLKLSTLPYSLLTSLVIYLITKELFDKKSAGISVILYTFLANCLYFDSLGLIFTPSVTIFLGFLYFLLKLVKRPTVMYGILTGICAALGYLFYFSSYTTFPIFIVSSLIGFSLHKKKFLISWVFFLLGFIVVLAPFLTQAFKYENYFLRRFTQVDLLTGSLSPETKKIEKGASSFSIIKKSTDRFIKSISNDGIGGGEGFDFNHLALFEPFTRFTLGLSLLIFLGLSFKRQKRFIVLISLMFCVLSVILSMPPPGYHRFTLAYPIFAIILTSPFYLILKSRLSFFLKFAICFIFIAIFIRNNYLYFLKASQDKLDSRRLTLSRIINSRYPNRDIYIDVYPSFDFEKVYYFAPHKKAKSITSNLHKNLINKINPDKKYIYVIMDKAYDKSYMEKDPNGKIVPFDEELHLFVN